MKKEDFNIAESMLRNLEAEKIEKQTHTNKLSIALACLDKAASLLDNMNDIQSSEKLTRVIEKLAKLG